MFAVQSALEARICENRRLPPSQEKRFENMKQQSKKGRGGIDVRGILSMVNKLSDKHILKHMPPQYVADFASAAVHVYDTRKIADLIQHKFHMPDDANFTEDSYLQSAAELSVANYVKGRAVSDFAVDKRMNPKRKTDVDVYYRVRSTSVALEVKCPYEEEQLPFPENITIVSAGHVPGYKTKVQKLINTFGSATSHIKFSEGKNREHRLKDALLSAHGKFPAEPQLDDLNILLLACGDFYKMSEWHAYLLGPGGLFTKESFHPVQRYRNVDCVILSSLKYRHKVAFDFPAWSLDDVLLIPIRNPHGRKNILDQTVHEGLSIFSHYLKEFRAGRIVTSQVEMVQDVPHTKVTRFVFEHLQNEIKRLFPITSGGSVPSP